MTHVVVVGFGVTGRATARALLAGGTTVVVVDDRRTEGAAAAALDLGVELVVGPDRALLQRLISAADMVVPSPGIPVGHPVYELAARRGVEVVSEIELAVRVLGSRPEPRPLLVAITGTNGKTTVTVQVRRALECSGLSALAAGNIGVPLIEAVSVPAGAVGAGPVAAARPDVVVAEVSSFQLQFTDHFRPDVSCWLNLAADHLDWHPTHAHYGAAKARIWANQGDGDIVVVNADDADVMRAARARPGGSRLVTFSMRTTADWYERGGFLVGPDGLDLLAADELPRSLPHDRANALAAAAVATAAGATPDGIRQALRETRPGPHRVEWVGAADGIAWYDDSKATTPASVLAATAGFDSVVLIAGGRNKGLDLGVLRATVPPVRAVVAIGEAAGEVTAAFAPLTRVTVATSMADAVAAARTFARRGDAVVLSPGCTSFDWYRSYSQRGDDYTGLVLHMLEKERDRC